jgi:GAF domain-containing protein
MALNSVESVARTLYDIALVFDAPSQTEPRLQRALGLVGRIVPNDRCALLDVAGPGPARLVVEPDAPEEHTALRRVLTRFLTILTDEERAGTGWQLPDIATLALWASPSHLAVPLIGFDQILGVLFVRRQMANGYTNDHLRLLSIVASQIATHLASCRLRDDARARDGLLTTAVRELRGLVANEQLAPMGRLLDGLLALRSPSV